MDAILKLPAVIQKTGKSRSSIYADKTFPRQIKLGKRACGWIESEIDDWIAARVAERDAKAV